MGTHRSPRGTLGRLAAAGLLVTGLVACGSGSGSGEGSEPGVGGRAPAELRGRDIVVVGDSVTRRSSAVIIDGLEGASVEIEAHEGFPSSALLPLVRDAVAARRDRGDRLDLIALLVGYNDVRVRKVDPSSLRALVREAARFRCAIWFTLPARPGGEDDPNDAVPSKLVDRWNANAAREVRRYRNVHLATDWADAVEEAPDPRTFLDTDGVHPNEAGRARLARAYREALARAC